LLTSRRGNQAYMQPGARYEGIFPPVDKKKMEKCEQ
jgi:hypothetical protein